MVWKKVSFKKVILGCDKWTCWTLNAKLTVIKSNGEWILWRISTSFLELDQEVKPCSDP
jgi:hypothetical protein